MEDILSKLNDAQRGAVTAPDGPVLVVAGAGSGKTRVLTTRIAWLLAERGVHPGGILAFTFTNRAAREMRERVAQGVGEGRAPYWIGTFHSTGLRILRADGVAAGVPHDFTIFDTDDSKKLLKQVLDDLKIDPKQFTPSGARSVISGWKNDDVDPVAALAQARSFVDEKHAAIYAGYEQGLARCRALDFDDLILRTVHLLEQDEVARMKYAERFHHVLVDEFQDTNPLQMVLIKLLSGVHGNLFAVGDDDQSIYSWRGARIENMLAFDEFFPGAVTCRLEQNYRSTGMILDVANAVIANNRRRKGKKGPQPLPAREHAVAHGPMELRRRLGLRGHDPVKGRVDPEPPRIHPGVHVRSAHSAPASSNRQVTAPSGALCSSISTRFSTSSSFCAQKRDSFIPSSNSPTASSRGTSGSSSRWTIFSRSASASSNFFLAMPVFLINFSILQSFPLGSQLFPCRALCELHRPGRPLPSCGRWRPRAAAALC